MPQIFPVNDKAVSFLHPIQCLEQLADAETTGYLQVSQGLIVWGFYFDRGALIYATHSLELCDRFDRHLRRLSAEIPTLTREVCLQVRLVLDSHTLDDLKSLYDYQIITWLVEQQYLSPEQAQILVKRLTQEVFESYLLLPEVSEKSFIKETAQLPIFCRFNLRKCLATCQKRLQSWQTLSPDIRSPYQRPYFFTNTYAQKRLAPEQQEKLGRVLKGFSFRHLAALLNEDELCLAQRLHLLIKNKVILLRDPQSPFDQLPYFSESINFLAPDEDCSPEDDTEIPLSNFTSPYLPEKTWTIVCVDDSPTMLREINRFLDTNSLSVVMINDSLKALMQIIRIRPDLILLDVEMPNIDGYKICSLIRKSPQFKTTPIIMATGKTGLIDRAKAKLAGATDYMIKPFTQGELLKIVFRYLT